MSNTTSLHLETLSETGGVPATRINDHRQAIELVKTMRRAGDKRNRTDAEVAGLFGGNPPYRQSELIKNAQEWRTNVNWRLAEAFRDVALTAYNDLIFSSPTLATVTMDDEDKERAIEWGNIVTEEFERLNKKDRDLNYMFTLSQHDMVLYRMGPVMWQGGFDYRAKAIPQSNLFVPDNTKSNVDDWPLAVIKTSYQIHELYSFIRNPKAAKDAGWNIEVARKAIMVAVDDREHSDDWIWHEQRLRNNDILYGSASEAVAVSWILWREFPEADEPEGRITQAAVVEAVPDGWLYRKEKKYENWRRVIAPFYFDTGDGTHYSVKGLGIKAYAALEAYNRLQCHLVDAAFFGSSMHFQAASPNDLENLAVISMGPYVWHPPGGQFLPTAQIGTALDGPMGIKQDILSTVTSNLSQYRQQVSNKRGNPPTARQIDYQAENETIIGRSQLNRYFEQLDDFYFERFRRAANPALTKGLPGAEAALEFQKRCVKRGLPKNFAQKVEFVRATRTIGYGSADARFQALKTMLSMIGMYNETGRFHILEDVTRHLAGNSVLRRYVPEPNALSKEEAEQRSQAMLQVASAKVGVPPSVTPSQNPLIFAQVFLEAATAGQQSVQQGANPADVFNFLQTILPAIEAHLGRMSSDPTREPMVKEMGVAYQQLMGFTQQLGAQLQKQAQSRMQEQQQLAQQQQAMQGDMMLKAQEAQGKMGIKRQEAEQRMAIKAAQAQQKARLSDATTAHKIRLSNATAKSAKASKE